MPYPLHSSMEVMAFAVDKVDRWYEIFDDGGVFIEADTNDNIILFDYIFSASPAQTRLLVSSHLIDDLNLITWGKLTCCYFSSEARSSSVS